MDNVEVISGMTIVHKRIFTQLYLNTEITHQHTVQ